jgi:C-terminal processing protease CtpA/Prc
VKYVESAASDAELASRLNQFFSPLAPLAHVLPSGAIPPPIGESEIYPPHPLGRIAWYHSGVGMPGAAGAQSQIYTSKRIVQDGRLFTKDALAASGGFYETISANGLRGKKIHFSIATKCDGAQGQGITVWVEPIIAGGGAGETAMGVVLSTSWQRSAVTATIPATADSIRFGTSLRGGGAMWLDDAELVADGSKKNLARDPGFELADHTMSSAWRSASSQFYIESIDHHDPASGEHSGKVQLLGVDKKYLAHFPSSDSLMKLDLGGGVAVRMPYALWLNEYGLLSGSHTKPMDSLDRMFVPSGGDRFVRLADIVIAWNVFRHFYPYFDVTKTDWTAELPEALAEASEAPDKEHFQRALQKMVAKLHDGHGNVFGGKKRNLVAPFQCRLIEGQIAVTATADQYKGNIRRGDIITSINGIDALRLLDSTRTYVSSATRQWSDFKILSNLFETLDTDMFVITVKRAGNKTETITEKPSRRIGMINDKKTKPVEELKPGIMYVDLDRVTKQLFDSVTPDLAKAKAIIFDMRGYPRGILRESIAHCIDTAVGSAFWCVPQQFYPDQSDTMWDITSWSVEPAAPRFTKNIIHITDGRAISAAETYMGIIEAYHIGDIVGSPTAGTNGNINPFPLPGGYSISWTGMRVLKHDGSRHHGVGISPTINIEPTIKGIRDGKDEVLEKAIETAEKNMK